MPTLKGTSLLEEAVFTHNMPTVSQERMPIPVSNGVPPKAGGTSTEYA